MAGGCGDPIFTLSERAWKRGHGHGDPRPDTPTDLTVHCCHCGGGPSNNLVTGRHSHLSQAQGSEGLSESWPDSMLLCHIGRASQRCPGPRSMHRALPRRCCWARSHTAGPAPGSTENPGSSSTCQPLPRCAWWVAGESAGGCHITGYQAAPRWGGRLVHGAQTSGAPIGRPPGPWQLYSR